MRLDGARSFGSRLLMAVTAAILVSSYQNCAQNGVGNSADPAAEDNHIVRAMEEASDDRSITSPVSAALAAEKSSDHCRPDRVHCLRKVYSPLEEDRQTSEVICAESSGHCFDVSTVFYNTVFALQECADCGPEAARPGGEYHREEITCWVGKPAIGETATFALRSDFESAVSSALSACGGSL